MTLPESSDYLSTMSDRGNGFLPLRDYSSEVIPADIDARIAQIEKRYQALTVDPKKATDSFSCITFFIEPTLRRWVVVHQGSGPAYGAAGTVQIACLSPSRQLRDCLPLIVGHLATGQFLTLDMLAGDSAPLPAGPPDADRLRESAASLLTMPDGGGLVLVPGDRDKTLPVLEALSLMVPESLARGWIWSTAFAGRNTSSQPVVTLDWPPELSARHQRVHDNVFGHQQFTADPSEVRGLDWLVSQTIHGRYPLANSTASTPTALLQELSAVVPLDPDEALRALRTGRLPASMAERWVPDDVSARLLAMHPELMPELAQSREPLVARASAEAAVASPELWRWLVGWQREVVRDSRNPPTSLSEMPSDLKRHLAEDVLSNSTVPQLHRASHWLVELGLSPDSAPALFPPTIEDLREGVQQGSTRVRELLLAGEQEDGDEGLLKEATWLARSPAHLPELLVETAVGDYADALTPRQVLELLSSAPGRDSLPDLLESVERQLMLLDGEGLKEEARCRIAKAVVLSRSTEISESVADDAPASQLLRFVLAIRVQKTRDDVEKKPDRRSILLQWCLVGIGGLLLLVTGILIGAFIW